MGMMHCSPLSLSLSLNPDLQPTTKRNQHCHHHVGQDQAGDEQHLAFLEIKQEEQKVTRVGKSHNNLSDMASAFWEGLESIPLTTGRHAGWMMDGPAESSTRIIRSVEAFFPLWHKVQIIYNINGSCFFFSPICKHNVPERSQQEGVDHAW